MEQAAQPPRRRPKLVWAIFLFTILSTVLVALSFALVLSGAIPLGPEEAKYVHNLTPADYAFTVFNGSLNLVAAIALFRLKGIAVYLYAAALVLGVLYTLVLAATTNFTMAWRRFGYERNADGLRAMGGRVRLRMALEGAGCFGVNGDAGELQSGTLEVST